MLSALGAAGLGFTAEAPSCGRYVITVKSTEKPSAFAPKTLRPPFDTTAIGEAYKNLNLVREHKRTAEAARKRIAKAEETV